ncbi:MULTISPECIES: DUF885 family protein [Saccharothrix]|uniref:DUF885 family protein n=1 Tax=Saccharothrix TaxID=2071 RepID=UPI00093FDCD6|nr:DUF885 family protein [Saccharothrix sp. CB00851]
MYEPEVRAYLRIGLLLGRMVDGFVDCWFGDPVLAGQVRDEPLPTAAELAAQATEVMALVADSALPDRRKRFLDAHLAAMRCSALRLSGGPVPFRAEVLDCFGVEIETGDQDRYREAHDEISALLPGTDDLRARLERFHDANSVGPEHLQRAVQSVSDALRPLVRARYGLPEGEHVRYEVVRDKPWNAFNRYLGGYRSLVMLDSGAGRNLAALPLLATHESYPGHHSEHCLKEAGLVERRGEGEHTLVVVNTPQCLLAEGVAEMALAGSIGDGWGAWTAAILAEQGLRVDGERLEAVMRSWWRLMGVRQDAAIMLHDRGASAEDVVDHLVRWLLLPEPRARHMVRFLTDPLWRAYTTTYVEGRRLVSEWLDARSEGETAADRFHHLLDEPVLPDELRGAAVPNHPIGQGSVVVPRTADGQRFVRGARIPVREATTVTSTADGSPPM